MVCHGCGEEVYAEHIADEITIEKTRYSIPFCTVQCYEQWLNKGNDPTNAVIIDEWELEEDNYY